MPPSTQGLAVAEYKCAKCLKVYTRSSHLRRHEANHAGNLPSHCSYCNRSFVRSDVARRHIKACAAKENQPIPPQKTRGTPRQACDNCARSKIACDRSYTCSSCRKNSLICSYTRIHSAIRARPVTPAANSSPSGRASVSFLLSFTNPHGGGPFEDFVAQNSAHPDWFIAEEHEDSTAYNNLGYNELLPSFFMSPWGEDSKKAAVEQQWTLQAKPDVLRLADRAKELISELSSLHHRLRQFDPETAPFFDTALARQVFTGMNLNNFIGASLFPFQRHMAVLHWPSFNPETVALPLLLAAFMVGCVFTVPTDDALLARQFLHIAEEYIFRAPKFQALIVEGSDSSVMQSDNLLEYVQAALLVNSTQMSMHDRRTCRRIRTQRHPSLVMAVGALNEAMAPQPPDSEWQAFIASELRVRCRYTAYLHDALFTIQFNNTPLMPVAELTSPLPCADALFEAESPEAFNQRRTATASTEQPPSSLASLVAILMQGDHCDAADEAALAGLTIRHLVGAIVALNALLFTLRSNNLLRSSHASLSGALFRWKELWDAVAARASADELQRGGFMQHADAFWWFATGVLRLAAAKQEGSYRHLADMTPRDDVADMHALVKEMKGSGVGDVW